MKINHKYFSLFAILVVVQTCFYGQENGLHDRLLAIKTEPLLIVFLDTLTLDTIFENHATGLIVVKSTGDVELVRGSRYGGLGTPCGCEPQPHGLWIKRYRNGNLKEIGEYFCNQKKGTWTYYHENRNLMKIETYASPYLEFLTEHGQSWDTLKNNSFLRSGLYAEYYANGMMKETGKYEIVEEFSESDTLTTFDPDTYQEIKTIVKGVFWIPKTVKTGTWKWTDEAGNLIKVEHYHPYGKDRTRYRPIASRYYEIFFHGKN